MQKNVRTFFSSINEKKCPLCFFFAFASGAKAKKKFYTTNFSNVCFWSGRSSMQAVVGKNVFYAGSHIMSGSARGEKKEREAK